MSQPLEPLALQPNGRLKPPERGPRTSAAKPREKVLKLLAFRTIDIFEQALEYDNGSNLARPLP